MVGLLRGRRARSRPSADLFHGPCDEDEKAVEDPNTQCGCLVAQSCARHVCVAYLNSDQSHSESDHGPLANRRHYVARQVEDNADRKQGDLQGKLGVAIVPQAKPYLGSVIIDREIAATAKR